MYTGILRNPANAPIESIKYTHSILAKHSFNREFVEKLSKMRIDCEVLEHCYFIRVASFDEAVVTENNVFQLSPENKTCPCVIFIDGIFYVLIPDESSVKVPTFGEWLACNKNPCRLCGVNISIVDGFCCELHKKLSVLEWGESKDIFHTCSMCKKQYTRMCACGKRYCSRSCQRMDKKNHIKTCIKK